MTYLLGEDIIIDYGAAVHVLTPVTPPNIYGQRYKEQ
jgi:hypothetical protein